MRRTTSPNEPPWGFKRSDLHINGVDRLWVAVVRAVSSVVCDPWLWDTLVPGIGGERHHLELTPSRGDLASDGWCVWPPCSQN